MKEFVSIGVLKEHAGESFSKGGLYEGQMEWSRDEETDRLVKIVDTQQKLSARKRKYGGNILMNY